MDGGENEDEWIKRQYRAGESQWMWRAIDVGNL